MQSGEPLSGRFDWLDYVRLICALWVMFGHFMVVGIHPTVGHGISDYGLATDIARFGTIAVFLFLMMSGLVITLVARRESAETFVTHRVARIYPSFFILMTLTALIGPLGPPKFHVTLPQYLANLAIDAPLFGYNFVGGVYWTLVIEIIFYLAVLVMVATGAIRRLQTVAVIWVLLQVAALALPRRLPLLGMEYSFLAAGVVFALYYQRRNERLNLALLAILLLLCLMCALHYARLYHADEIITAGLTIGIFALFLFMRGRNPRLPAATRIGSMTYPLYLVHYHAGLTVFFLWINEANKWALVLGTSAILIALSFLFDDIVEFRMRRFWRKLARQTVARPFARWDRWMARRGDATKPQSGEAADLPPPATQSA